MKMQVFYETIGEILNQPKEEWNTLWAYKLCQQTRFVGQKILECFPDASEVEGLLKLLEHSPEKVKSAKDEGPYKGHLHEFAGSMEERLNDMRTYVAGMSAQPEPPETKKTSWKTKLTHGVRNLLGKWWRRPTTAAHQNSGP